MKSGRMNSSQKPFKLNESRPHSVSGDLNPISVPTQLEHTFVSDLELTNAYHAKQVSVKTLKGPSDLESIINTMIETKIEDLIDTKSANTLRYTKKKSVANGARRNAREQRRRHKASKIKPHSQESPESNTDSDDDPTESDLDSRREIWPNNYFSSSDSESEDPPEHDAPPGTPESADELILPAYAALPLDPGYQSSSDSSYEDWLVESLKLRCYSNDSSDETEQPPEPPLPPPFPVIHGSMTPENILQMYRDNGYSSRIIWGAVPHAQEKPDPTTPREYSGPLNHDDLLHAASAAVPGLISSDDSELADLLATISEVGAGIEDPSIDEWASHLENLVILGYQISKADTFMDLFITVLGYIKMNTSKSILKEILSLIDGVMTFTDRENVEPAALSGNDVIRNWDLFKSNAIFTKISYLLSAAMSIGVCDAKKIEWSVMGLELVAVEAAKVQLKAVDVIDAVIHTFTWFAETGYRVFEEKSLMPLLYTDSAMQNFNVECDYILANADSYLAGNMGDITEFDHRLQKTLSEVSKLKATQDTGPTAIWLQTRYQALIQIGHRVVSKYKNTAIRFAALGLCLTGPTSVGKSTLAKILMKVSLNAMDFPTDEKRIITIDTYEAFDSLMTSDILGFYIDDIGNSKSNFAVRSPTEIIIKFFNNMAATAIKAELNLKGVVFLGGKVGICTSNKVDMDVRSYTNCPESILRRFFFIRVTIKPKYRKLGSIMLNKSHPDLVGTELTHDVWNLTIEETIPFETREGVATYKFKVMTVKMANGKQLYCKNISFAQCVDVVILLAEQHKREQDSVISRDKGFNNMSCCLTCKRPTAMCEKTCPGIAARLSPSPKEVEPAAFEVLEELVTGSMKRAALEFYAYYTDPMSWVSYWLGYSRINTMATDFLTNEFTEVMNESITPLMISVTPEFVFQSRAFGRLIDVWQKSAASYDVRRPMKWLTYFTTIWFAYAVCRWSKWHMFFSFLTAFSGTLVLWSHYRARKRIYEEEYIARRDALPAYAKVMRDSRVTKGAFAISTLVVGLKLFQMWNARRDRIDTHAGSKENPGWFGFVMHKMGVNVEVSESSKRATPTQLLDTVTKNNLFWCSFSKPDGTVAQCNVFFPRKNVVLFPKHMFFTKSDMNTPHLSSLLLKINRHNKPGGKFEVKVDYDMCVCVPDMDMVAAYVPNCPDLRDKSKWLPLTKPKGTSMCTLLARDNDIFVSERISVDHKRLGHKYMEFDGGDYTSSIAKDGSCMGCLVLEQNNPVLIGFHIGGVIAHQYGVMQTLTKDVYDSVLKKLEEVPGVILSSLSEDMPTSQYNKPIIATSAIHPNSMCARLDDSAYIDLMGSTVLRTEQKTRVEQSILSETVSSVCGVPNQWAGPHLKPNWKGFNDTLEHIVDPADMFSPVALEAAREDWIAPLRGLMKKFTAEEACRPLDPLTTVIGRPGVRFIDAMVMKTGCGFPIFGPKNLHFEDGIPDESVQAEFDRMTECWKQGVRAYPVTASTLKDEPTKIGVEKVRVFQASPVALTMAIRMYFLPIARFLQLHPLVSESAVGLNAFGKEWDGLMSHATRFETQSKIIAWDYSKYDVRMNSQMTRSVFCCYIELAEIAGYSSEDLHIMRNMITDIVHPLIDYNGILFKAYNMNTSGNSLTVNTNSIAGSLYVRLGFFHVYPGENFRSCVSAMTYGDDFIGSVKEGYRDFNFESYKRFLLDHKIKITLPDKSEDIKQFMKVGEADFLKRKSNYIPEIGCSIGKLDENSIFKSLHSNLQSAGATRQEVAISCLEGAMHEWFAHGRGHYNMRAEQMQEICDRVSLPVPAVRVTFDERVEFWLNKYTSPTSG